MSDSFPFLLTIALHVWHDILPDCLRCRRTSGGLSSSSLLSSVSSSSPDMAQLKEGVRNVAGRLSSMANNVYNAIPVSINVFAVGIPMYDVIMTSL